MAVVSTTYSAEMAGFLLVAGRRLALGQLGPAHCIVRESVTLPSTAAEILVLTDGRESKFPVFLPDGISPTEDRVAYRPLNPEP